MADRVIPSARRRGTPVRWSHGSLRRLQAVLAHPWLVDAAITAAVLAVSLPSALLDDRKAALTVPLTLGLVVPLVARRRAPEAVFAVIAAVALAQWVSGARLVGDVALLAAFGTVAARRPPRTAMAAAVVLEFGVVLATTSWAVESWLLTFVLLSGMVTAAGVMGANQQARRAQLAYLQDRADRVERERDRELSLAAATERTRIARELHDIVAHHLTVVVTLAEAAGVMGTGVAGNGVAGNGVGPPAGELMATVAATGRTALSEMRRLLGVLHEDTETDPGPDEPAARSRYEPQPDLDRLDDLLTAVRAAGLPVQLRVSGTRLALEPGAGLALYRCVQESLTNVLKHAGPGTSAVVSVAYRTGSVTVRVTDDGGGAVQVRPAASGQQLRASVPPTGHGLIGMRERVAACGGALRSGSVSGGGWEVRVEVPVPTPPAVGGRSG